MTRTPLRRSTSLALALAGALACGPEREPAEAEAAAVTTAPRWTRSIAGAYGAQLALAPSGRVLVAGSVPYTAAVLASYDADGTLLWQQTFGATGTRAQAAWVAADGDGNAFVAATLVFGAGQDPGGLVLLKYDPAGTLLWSDVVPLTYGEAVRVETDAAGNAYLAAKGWLSGSSTYVDFLTFKYAPDGTRLWLRSHGLGTATDVPASLAVAADGRVAVTGSPSGGSPMVTVVYAPDGAVLWTQGAPDGRARDVAFGPGGEVYVAGGTNALVVVKHDPEGRAVWTARVPGFSAERVGLDAAGNVLVAGTALQTSGMPYTDWITAKLDPSGALLWARRYDAHGANDEAPRALAVAADGAVVVTGHGGPGPSTGVLSYLQTVTLEYAPDGALTWIATTPDAVGGVGVRVAGGSAFVVARAPMTTFRLERVAAEAAAPVPPPPLPPPPLPPPPGVEPAPVVSPTIVVADLTLSARRAGTKVRVTGRAFVRDGSGAAVPGATVDFRWTTPTGVLAARAQTDAAGVAATSVPGRPGTYTLAVTGVAKDGYLYDAARSVTTRSITAR